jgi:hypothetical protein
MRPLSWAKLSIRSVLGFLCWKWKPYPRVAFCKSSLLYIWEGCCLWRVLTCIQVSSTFCWGWFLVVSVLWKCVYARYVFCQGAARYLTSSWGSLLFIWKGGEGTFLFVWCHRDTEYLVFAVVICSVEKWNVIIICSYKLNNKSSPE